MKRHTDLANSRIIILLFSFIILTLTKSTYADVIWPAVYLVDRLYSIWVILIGLIIEYLFIRYYFNLTTKKAITADIVMNAVSTGFGIFLIPIFGLAYEYSFGDVINNKFDWGTFNPIAWAITYLIAVIVNSLLEPLVLRAIFKVKLTMVNFGIIFLANAISVGVAIISFGFFPRGSM